VAAQPLRGARLAALSLLFVVCSLPLEVRAQATKAQWGTYFGTNGGSDNFLGMAQDDSGNIAVSGFSESSDAAGRVLEIAVARFFNTGALRHKLEFGGEGLDIGYAVAIAPDSSLYVVGFTRSNTISTGPMVRHSTYGINSGNGDAFLAKVDTSGELQWFMFLGGTGADLAFGLAVTADAVYVVGRTDSPSFSGVTGSGLGKMDGFVAKVNPSSSPPRVEWLKYVGGGEDDELQRIVVQGDGLLALGATGSTNINAPRVVQAYHGGTDALVVRLQADTGAPLWASHVGGAGKDGGRALVVAPNGPGRIVVAGTTDSADFGQRPRSSAGDDAFVAWLSEEGIEQRVRVQGGSAMEYATSVAVDASGNAYVSGTTTSGDFPVLYALDSTIEPTAEAQEGFVFMSPAQEGSGWSTFVGGSGADTANGVSVQGNRLVVAGGTYSTGMATPGAYDETLDGQVDGLLVSFEADVSAPVAGTISVQVQPEREGEESKSVVSSLTVSWSGFSDPETSIARYEWALGTQENPEALRPFSVSAEPSAMLQEVSLVEGTQYALTVRAHNGAGLATTVSSAVALPEPQPALGWQCATTGQAPLSALGLLLLAFWRRRLRDQKA
jgi:MYXO-CTERM domain-containing protein